MPHNPCDPPARRRARGHQARWPLCRIRARPGPSLRCGPQSITLTGDHAGEPGRFCPAPPGGSAAEDMLRRVAAEYLAMNQRWDLITGGLLCGNFGFPVSFGPLSQQAAQMLWGDARTGTDVPPGDGFRHVVDLAQFGRRPPIHLAPNPVHIPPGVPATPQRPLRRVLAKVWRALARHWPRPARP